MSNSNNNNKLVMDFNSSSSAAVATNTTKVASAAAATAASLFATMKETATAAPSAVSRKKKKEASKEAKRRPGRFRASCPQHLRDRMNRAISQPLYLVERQEVLDGECQESCNFVVLGSTGNVYTVTLQGNLCCTCPDFIKRGGDLCKHLIFVLVKVIGLSTNDPLSFQKAYLPSEVRYLLQLARGRRVGGAVLADQQVQQQFAKVVKSGGDGNGEHEHDNSNEHDDGNQGIQRRSLEHDSDCPICFDEMTNLSETTYCRAQCGFNFHTKCIRLWCQRTTNGTGATCPACRQPWLQDEDDNTSGGQDAASSSSNKRGAVNEEGYVNLGSLQGQSPQRDTSTYYSPWRNGGGEGFYNCSNKRSRRRY